MGRRLVMGFFSMMVFGEDNPLSKLFLGGLNYTDRKFNQQQETDCDLYGASLVFHKYGHLGGGLKFFERLGESEGMLHKYLSTHPLSQDRMKRIESEAMKQNWPLTGESIRLAPQKGSSSDSL
jgi:predicted Zn-dependent protease